MAEQIWTDPTLSVAIKVKAVHFDELMDAINAWETAYSILNTSWTQDEPDDSMPIDDVSIDEMQDAMDAIDVLISDKYGWSWTAADLGTTVSGGEADDHIDQLRTRVNLIQDQDCYLCHTCDSYTACVTCNGPCHTYTCSVCYSKCYSYTCCTCNNCHGTHDDKGCGSCHNSCNGYSCCSCNQSCHSSLSCTICNTSCNLFVCTACDVADYVYPWT